MSQSDTDKALAAEERRQETKSFGRRVRSVTRRKYTSEEKIRVVLEGFRREVTVNDLCRREGIKPHSYIARHSMSENREYDIVISGGRVMDPESGLDAVRNVGISEGVIRELRDSPIEGHETIDATGLVVAPGFIDLHSHGQDAENYRVQALDGVTTALELEAGAGDIDAWYGQREGNALINFGASAGHIPARIEVMHDPGDFLPIADAANRAASEAEIAAIVGLPTSDPRTASLRGPTDIAAAVAGSADKRL